MLTFIAGVGDALGKLGDGVRCGRRHQERVDRLGHRDVLNSGVEIRGFGIGPEHAGYDLLARERSKCQGTHELLRSGGHHDLHTHAAFL